MAPPICALDIVILGFFTYAKTTKEAIKLLLPAIANGFQFTSFIKTPAVLHNTEAIIRYIIDFTLSFLNENILFTPHKPNSSPNIFQKTSRHF